MTGDQFSGVDDDLLADYVGGALAGTPQEAEVAGRIADDPDWRAAYDEVSRAMAAVSVQLGTLAGPDEPMPADVAARIDAALAEAPRPLTVLSGGATSSARSRRPRWAAAVAAAAAVVVFAGIGIGLVNRPSSSNDAATSAAAGSAEKPVEPLMSVSVALPPTGRITSSGTDYEPGTLGHPQPRPGTKENRQSPADVNEAADPLARLRASAALEACLAAIAAANGDHPLTVESVDYARYAGKPALIVVFTAANGRFAWASGPDCGASGVGADRLDAVPVG